jgi:hypothetical protein
MVAVSNIERTHIVRSVCFCRTIAVLMTRGTDEDYLWIFIAQGDRVAQALSIGAKANCTWACVAYHQIATVATHKTILQY